MLVGIETRKGDFTYYGNVDYDNILLTENGIRLIDVGISALREQVGDKIFEKYLEVENAEIGAFREYFLNR